MGSGGSIVIDNHKLQGVNYRTFSDVAMQSPADTHGFLPQNSPLIDVTLGNNNSGAIGAIRDKTIDAVDFLVVIFSVGSSAR